MSHGESFLELIVDRFREGGLWVLDEPESALSFSGCLALVGILKDLDGPGRFPGGHVHALAAAGVPARGRHLRGRPVGVAAHAAGTSWIW